MMPSFPLDLEWLEFSCACVNDLIWQLTLSNGANNKKPCIMYSPSPLPAWRDQPHTQDSQVSRHTHRGSTEHEHIQQHASFWPIWHWWRALNSKTRFFFFMSNAKIAPSPYKRTGVAARITRRWVRAPGPDSLCPRALPRPCTRGTDKPSVGRLKYVNNHFLTLFEN